MRNQARRVVERIRYWLSLILSLGFVALVWGVAFRQFGEAAPGILEATVIGQRDGFGDLATLLFGTASVALVILSFVVSVLAIFGWGHIKQVIQDEVQKALADRMQQLGGELRGRIFSHHGHVLGMQAIDAKTLVPLNPELLREAVDHCDVGYKFFERLGESSANLPGKFMALNNLVFYGALLWAANPGTGPVANLRPADWLLRQARHLRKMAEDNDQGGTGSLDIFLTYCCAVVSLSEDRQETQDALEVARRIAKRRDRALKHEREAEIYISSLSRRLTDLSREKVGERQTEPK